MVCGHAQDGNDHDMHSCHRCCCGLQHGCLWPARATVLATTSASCPRPSAAWADMVTLQRTFWMCCMRLGLSCPLESRLPEGLSWAPDLLRDPASCLFMDQLPERSTASALPRRLSPRSSLCAATFVRPADALGSSVPWSSGGAEHWLLLIEGMPATQLMQARAPPHCRGFSLTVLKPCTQRRLRVAARGGQNPRPRSTGRSTPA